MAKPKKKRDKPWIEKLTEVLNGLEDDCDCTALQYIRVRIENAQDCAKEICNELLELQDLRVDHEALLKQVRDFFNATAVDVEVVRIKEEGAE